MDETSKIVAWKYQGNTISFDYFFVNSQPIRVEQRTVFVSNLKPKSKSIYIQGIWEIRPDVYLVIYADGEECNIIKC